MKKVIFIAYGGGHANIIRFVYKQIRKYDSIEPIIVALTTAPKIYEKHDIPYLTISEFCRILPNYNDIVKIGRAIGTDYHNQQLGLSFVDTIVYYGVGYHDLCIEYGAVIAKEKFERMGRKAFLPVGTLKELFKAYQPDTIVVTSSPRMEKAAGIAANQLGIPVVKIEDLPIMRDYSFDAKVCVMNSWAKNYAKSHFSIAPESIIVTGQPVFEDELKLAVHDTANFKKHILGEKEKLVVFFTRNDFDETNILRAIDHFATLHKNIKFIFKLHPNQCLEKCYQPIADNITLSKEDAKLFASACDLAITAWSTTGLESVLLDKPLIEVNFFNEKFPMDYADMGLAELASNPEELAFYIVNLLDCNSKHFLRLKAKRMKFENMLNASENICNVIKRELNKHI